MRPKSRPCPKKKIVRGGGEATRRRHKIWDLRGGGNVPSRLSYDRAKVRTEGKRETQKTRNEILRQKLKPKGTSAGPQT